MGNPASVPYRWTELDNLIRVSTDPELLRKNPSRLVTPYGVPVASFENASTLVPGNKPSVSLTKSYQGWYIAALVPPGYDWLPIPDEVKGEATIESLCSALLKLNEIYTPEYYDLANRKKLRSSGLSLPQMLFDYWKNTDYRFACSVAMSKKIDLAHVTADLATKFPIAVPDKTGDEPIGWVLAKKPTVVKTPVVAGNQEKKEPWGEPPKMKVGMSYAWAFNKFGLYFGPHSETWMDRWLDFFKQNLVEMKLLGIEVLRIWLLCNGENYGAPASGHFDPPSALDPAFRDHMIKMLDIVKESGTGIQLIPSLISFEFFIARNDVGTDPAKRNTFLTTVLEPLLETSKSYGCGSIAAG